VNTETRYAVMLRHPSEMHPMTWTIEEIREKARETATRLESGLPGSRVWNAIVRACNAHDELVAALREMTLCFGAGPASEEWWEAEHDRRGPGGDGLSSEQIRNAVTERARAALAKAGAL